MAEPVIAQRGPYKFDVQPGTYWWCACGRSANQPFCNGSHRGTELSPVEVVVVEPEFIYFCGCKHTANPPRCDGSHRKLPAS
jgi:CDGSH iron-sulfur domain-containing protein 3